MFTVKAQVGWFDCNHLSSYYMHFCLIYKLIHSMHVREQELGLEMRTPSRSAATR